MEIIVHFDNEKLADGGVSYDFFDSRFAAPLSSPLLSWSLSILSTVDRCIMYY